ncbi:MAG: hypothetical protein AB3N28_14235 [Kordiimonas sp.]
MTARLGYEFAKFRLKEGANKEALLTASVAMDEGFFPEQEGFVSHTLIELDGDEYVDIVVATTQEQAEKMCGNWQGNKYCEAFLNHIDPDTVSIGFGTSLTNTNKEA